MNGALCPNTGDECLSASFQKQAMLVRQLEEELRHQKTRGLSVEVQSQLENLSTENDHLTREVAILRETIKVSTPSVDQEVANLSSNILSHPFPLPVCSCHLVSPLRLHTLDVPLDPDLYGSGRLPPLHHNSNAWMPEPDALLCSVEVVCSS